MVKENYSLDFGIKRNYRYITFREITFKNVTVPKGFIFDGVTVKTPFTFLFSNKTLRQGIKASCFHDYMCLHKDKYTRKESTDILVEIWKADGLDNFRAFFVKVMVNVYQWLKGWK